MDKVYRVNNLLIMERIEDGVDASMIVNLDLVMNIHNFNKGNTIILQGTQVVKVDSEWFEQIMQLWIEYVGYGS